MPELLCENNCTRHEVQLDENDMQTIANMFGEVDYELENVNFDEISKRIVITLKES